MNTTAIVLMIVLGAWNQTVPPGDPLADPSGDGFIGIGDLNTVLSIGTRARRRPEVTPVFQSPPASRCWVWVASRYSDGRFNLLAEAIDSAGVRLTAAGRLT